jgi:hypothetical protein
MKLNLSFFYFALFAFISISTHAAKVIYVGTYTHENKPALMVQFDEKSYSKDLVQIIDIKTKEDLSNHWKYNENNSALINTQVIAGNSYKVTLKGNISYDVERESVIVIPEVEPNLVVLSKGPIVPANGSRTIPISTTNLSSLSVEVLQVLSPEILINKFYYNHKVSAYDLDKNKKYFKSITTLSFELPKSKKNAAINTSIQLPSKLENGWYILSVKGGGMMREHDAKIIQAFITDIGIQTKIFSENISVSSTSLSTNKPTPNGDVYIYKNDGRKKHLGKLQNGLANFKYKASSDELLVIKANNELGILPLREVPLDLSDFNVTGKNWQEIEAFTYSNRDLFKPGETLPLNIILRDDDGQPLTKQRLFIEFYQPDGKIVSTRWLEPKVNGYYRTDYNISSDASLGKWTARVKPNKDSKTIFNSFSFNVSEFVPERMDLIIDIENKTLVSSKNVKAEVEGRYLFGAPASGNELKIKPYYYGVNYIKGDYEDFFVGKVMNVFLSRDLPNIETIKLNAEGKSSLNIPLINESLLISPVVASFNFELLETGGATVSRKQEINLWKNNVIAGIRPKFETAEYFKDVEFDLALVEPTGDNLSAGIINYTLERNRGGYYWSHSASTGWQLHRDNEWRPVAIKTINVQKDTSTNITLPVEYGQYRLVAKTEEGLETQYDFYVGWREGKTKNSPIKPDALNLTFDKANYQEGDTIKANLQADLTGNLLITLETNQVHWQKSFEYYGQELDLNIPLPSNLTRHDIYVTATLIGKQQNMPRRMFTVKPVKLSRSSRNISVVIENKEKLQPLEKVKFSVKTDIGLSDNAFVTLSVVDRGILNLSGYKAPNITEYFFGHRRYSGDVVDLYSRVYQQRPDSFLIHRYGGDYTALANEKPKKLVESKTVILMSDLVPLDAYGNADIELDLPDYNGEAEIVATVFTDNSYGQTQKNVKISSPIVAELAVPRFLTPKDQSQVLLELFNTSGNTQDISAIVSSNDAISFDSENSIVTKLKDGERTSLAIPFTVNNFSETAKLTIDIDSPIFKQKRSWTVPVRAPKPLLTKKSSITLSPGEKFMVNQQYWEQLQPISSDMGNISFSPVPFLDPIEYASTLYRYPYGCAEQTTSKALPWLIENPSLDKLKTKALNGRTIEQMLEMAVMRLTKMQKANGGFSLWDKSGDEDGWLSVYVTDFLLQVTNKHPNIVPANMLESALKRIGNYTTEWGSPTQYYAAWVLAKANKLEYSKLVFVEKSQLQTPLSAAHIGGAAMLLGDMSKAHFYFSKLLTYKRNASYYKYKDYGSTIRDYAQTVAIIGKLQQEVKLSPSIIKLRNSLVAEIQDKIISKRYFSTQEKIALVNAGSDLSKSNSKRYNFIVDGKNNYYKGLNSAKMSAGTIVENTNDHELFIQLRAKGYNGENGYLQSTIRMDSFDKQFKFEDGRPYNGSSVAVGEKLIVTLSFETKEQVENSMLVDYIPTGFVLENPDFTNSSDILASNKLVNSDNDFTEYRNDRFVASLNLRSRNRYTFNYVIRAETPGESIVPESYLEDMYSPERFVFTKPTIKSIDIVTDRSASKKLKNFLEVLFNDD